jgi:hypothetical protein
MGPRSALAGLLTVLVVLIASQGTAAAAAPAGPPAAGGIAAPVAAGTDDGPVEDPPPDPLAESGADLAPATDATAKPLAGTTDLVSFFGTALAWIDHGSFGLDRARMVADRSAPKGRLLRVAYPAGSASPTVARSGAKSGGAQSYLRLPRSVDAMTLTYSVRFQPGFKFVKGGKLPGLFGGDAGSGGHHKAAGFSTRFMWRAAGAGEVYAYFPQATVHPGTVGPDRAAGGAQQPGPQERNGDRVGERPTGVHAGRPDLPNPGQRAYRRAVLLDLLRWW